MIQARESRTFRRFFWTYLVFAALLLLLLIPVFFYANGILYSVELERSVTRLNEGIAALDAVTEGLTSVVNTTGQDTRFRIFSYLNKGDRIDTTNLPGLQASFQGLMTPYGLISDAGLLLGEEVIITRQRSFFSSTYYSLYEDFFQCEGYSFLEWRALLEENRDRLLPAMTYWSHDHGRYEALTYAAPWPTNAPTMQSLFYATIRTDALLRALVDDDVRPGAYVHIYDANDRLLMAYGDAAAGSHHPITSGTARNSLRIEVGVPRAILSARLMPVYRLMLMYGLLILLAAIVMVVLFAYRSASPIRRLLELFTSQRGGAAAAPAGGRMWDFQGDYRFLASGISAMRDDLFQYEQTVEAQKHLLASHLLEKALTRGLYTIEERAQFAAMFPAMPQLYRVAVYRYASGAPAGSTPSADLQLQMLDTLADRAPIVTCIENDQLILILPAAAGQDDTQASHALLQAIYDELMARHAPGSLRCLVSDVYQRPSDLARAYQQAMSLEGIATAAVTGPAGMPTQRVRLPVNVSDIQTIYSALSAGNLQVALSVLEDCTGALLNQDENAMFCKHAYTMISQMLVQLKLENPSTLFPIVLPAYSNAERAQLFETELPACFGAICDAIWSERDSAEADAQRIIGFVEEHLRDPDLGVPMAAEHFGVSGRTLQKLVKDAVGQTFAAYVEEQRLARAYHLLSDLSLSVNETADQCGFASPNSFYKAFKRKYGIAPGQVVKKPRPSE